MANSCRIRGLKQHAAFGPLRTPVNGTASIADPRPGRGGVAWAPEHLNVNQMLG